MPSTGSSRWSGSTRSGPWPSAIRRDALRDEDVVATARTIAALPRGRREALRAPVVAAGRGCLAATTSTSSRTPAASELTPARTEAWRRFASGFLRRRAAELDERARTGTGRGRARRPARGARRARPARASWSSIASSSTRDCGASTSPTISRSSSWICAGSAPDWAAEDLVTAYRDAGGDPGDEALVAGFAVYRALVRAKVGFLRAAQLTGAGGGGGTPRCPAPHGPRRRARLDALAGRCCSWCRALRRAASRRSRPRLHRRAISPCSPPMSCARRPSRCPPAPRAGRGVHA